MKCDQCSHRFTDDQEYLLGGGSFGQPMFFCDDKCRDKFYSDDEEKTEEVNEAAG